jgi:hypothetical protein
VGTGRKHHEIPKENYRVERRLNQPKQKGASGGIQTKDGVHTSNTYTRHRKNAITRIPFCRVSLTTEYILWECTETTKERRETRPTKEVGTDETEKLKRLIEYTKKIGLFHGI